MLCDDDSGHDQVDLESFEFTEAVARLNRGELSEGLLWLGRALPQLRPAYDLYEAEKIGRSAGVSQLSSRRAA